MTETTIRFLGRTDVGQRRKHNEDAFHASEDDHYCMLADGMGGRMFGEVAANMAVDLLRERFDTFFPQSLRSLRSSEQQHVADMVVCLLDEWIRDTNHTIWQKGQSDGKYREMGTTLVFAYCLPSMVVISHIGDSRIYRVSGGTMSQLTRDHSLVNSQLEGGLITSEEAESSVQKNIITRALGTVEKVKPDFDIVRVNPGDQLLLCSDGLSDMVEDDEIRDIMLASDSMEDALESLVQAANANGGRDNITVVIAAFGS